MLRSKIRFEPYEVGAAHRTLLIRHHLQRVGAVIEPILPFDAGAEGRDAQLAEGGGMAEKDLEMPRTVNETGQIDPIFRAVRPSEVDRPWCASGAY